MSFQLFFRWLLPLLCTGGRGKGKPPALRSSAFPSNRRHRPYTMRYIGLLLFAEPLLKRAFGFFLPPCPREKCTRAGKLLVDRRCTPRVRIIRRCSTSTCQVSSPRAERGITVEAHQNPVGSFDSRNAGNVLRRCRRRRHESLVLGTV